MQRDDYLTKNEFEGWAGEIKASFTRVEERLNEHTQILNEHTQILNEHTKRLDAIERTLAVHTGLFEQIVTTLRDIKQELHALNSAIRRLDHRDRVFADRLGVDLSKVDAEA